MWHKRRMIVHESDPYNAEPPRGRLLAPFTAADSFYVRNHGPVPELSPDTWSVLVTGLVSEPVTLSLKQLQERFAHHTVPATMQCAGNRRSGFLPVRDVPGGGSLGPRGHFHRTVDRGTPR